MAIELLKEEVKERRALYMLDPSAQAHNEYYLWLADKIGVRAEGVAACIGEARIKASTDKHFNDIPLQAWDNLDTGIRLHAHAHGLPWSLSDSVCVAKALARRFVNQMQQQD